MIKVFLQKNDQVPVFPVFANVNASVKSVKAEISQKVPRVLLESIASIEFGITERLKFKMPTSDRRMQYDDIKMRIEK